MAAAEPLKKEAPPKDAPAPVRPIKARKTSVLPWLILTLLLIGLGTAGAWFALHPAAIASPAAAAAPTTDAPAQPRAAAIYYKFDPPFVVNFGGEGGTRYLQVTVEAMSRDTAVLEVLKNNEPAVRNDLVLLFSSQDNTALMGADGKEKLRAATLAAIRKVLDSEGAAGKLIEAVYFTSFVIQ
jgi:flagellar protein FliL